MSAGTRAGHDVPAVEALRFLGGRLCLDFTNTVDPRTGKAALECLASYADLLKWSLRAGVISEDETQRLFEEAHLHPAEAMAIWEHAIELREMIYRIFSAVAQRATPQPEDLLALKRAFIDTMTHARIASTSDGYSWDWIKQDDAFGRMLWPVVGSAVDLLTSEDAKRVKQCPGLGDCGWLFLDSSKNRSRQWCSMDGCGSRAKMRHHYARKRAAVTGRFLRG